SYRETCPTARYTMGTQHRLVIYVSTHTRTHTHTHKHKHNLKLKHREPSSALNLFPSVLPAACPAAHRRAQDASLSDTFSLTHSLSLFVLLYHSLPSPVHGPQSLHSFLPPS